MSQHILYLFDTNVLLHDPQSLFQFTDGIIGIPISVIGELDVFKKESSERGYNARESIRMLDELRQKGSLTQGVPLNNGGIVKILITPPSREYVDDQIINTALQQKDSGWNVIIISKDITLRIKADAQGITAKDYEANTVSKDNFYRGWIEFLASMHDIKHHPEKLLSQVMQEYKPCINEFICLKSQHCQTVCRIFRYTSKKEFLEINPTAQLWNIVARNHHQAMVIYLLLDDSIQLVILLGPSGTGKTLLVLACLLYKVLISSTYQKLLISRPLVPLGPDIGYLPGDLQEKLQTWMQPVQDNLEYLIYQINNENSRSYNSPEEYTFQHNKKKKNNKKNSDWVHHDNKQPRLNIEHLLGPQGKISLEAITYMRGRSIPYQAIFIDEVQNLTPHEVKTLISRAGEGSKVVLAGDPYQIDSPYLDFTSNGLVVACERFKGQAIFGTVYLQISERSMLSCLANELM